MQIMSAMNIQENLIDKIAALTGFAKQQIDVSAPLAEYGLDSVHAVGLSGDIEDWLGIAVEPTIAWDFPTIAEMSEYLASCIKQAA